jgi:molybdenum cofactor cytidylyltransferase
MSIAGVVLAAGASTRLGAPKQLIADDHGETLAHRAVRQLMEAGCEPIFVVIGATRSEVIAAISDLPAVIVVNHEWEEGIASSIRSAVGAARAYQRATGVDETTQRDTGGREVVLPRSTAIDALLLTTCDMPTVGTRHLESLCTAYIDGAVRVASRYTTPAGTETVGIPAVVGALEWPVLESLHGDRGAKPLFYEDGTMTVPLVGGSFDIDRPSDVQAWRDIQTE